MTSFKNILCPIDLSENSLMAISIAASIAKDHGATLHFLYVEPPLLPEEPLIGHSVDRAVLEDDRAVFEEIRPPEPSIPFTSHVRSGEEGPEIVSFSSEKDIDLIVMCTHGRSGILRFLMGSVAEYVVRNVDCPVITFKNPQMKPKQTDSRERSASAESVKSVMLDVRPIHAFDQISQITKRFESSDITAAPVVDEQGICIGILTTTDLDRYRDLKRRYLAKDPTVIDEMFEVDEFGQRRTDNQSFEQVRRHMTAPVLTVSASTTCDEASELFSNQPTIHHLVVVDEGRRPLGMLVAKDLQQDAVSSKSSN